MKTLFMIGGTMGVGKTTVGKLLKELAAERNKAVIVVTHDLRLRQFADKIYQLEDGKLKREKVPQ